VTTSCELWNSVFPEYDDDTDDEYANDDTDDDTDDADEHDNDDSEYADVSKYDDEYHTSDDEDR